VAKRELLTVSLTRSAERVAMGEQPTRGADAFLGDAAAAGREPGQDPPMIIVTNASDQVASLLGLFPGALVVGRQLIRSAGRTRHNMIIFWFPFDVADGSPLMRPESIEEGSLAWLEKRYGKLDHAPATIWPRMPTADEAAVLAIPPNVPVAEVWRTSLMQGGLPVVTSMGLYPGDRAVLRIEI
jgi:GntR family transcriptional regulator